MALRFAICFIEPAIAFSVLHHRRQITNPGSLYERTTQACNNIDPDKSTFRAVSNYPTNFRCRNSKKTDFQKNNEHAASHPNPCTTRQSRHDHKNNGQQTRNVRIAAKGAILPTRSAPYTKISRATSTSQRNRRANTATNYQFNINLSI